MGGGSWVQGGRECFATQDAQLKNVRWPERYRIGWLVTHLCVSDFERLRPSSLSWLFVYPSMVCADLVWLKGLKPVMDRPGRG